MHRESLDDQIKLIFAKACADSLPKGVEHILTEQAEARMAAIEAVAQLHATACLKMMAAFNPSTSPELTFPIGMTSPEKAAWLGDQAARWVSIARTSREMKERLDAAQADQPSPLRGGCHQSLSQEHQSQRRGELAVGAQAEERQEARPLASDELR